MNLIDRNIWLGTTNRRRRQQQCLKVNKSFIHIHTLTPKGPKDSKVKKKQARV